MADEEEAEEEEVWRGLVHIELRDKCKQVWGFLNCLCLSGRSQGGGEMVVGVCEWVSTVVACERALSECMNAIILL